MSKDSLALEYNQKSAVEYRWKELDKLMKNIDLDVVMIYGKGIITQYSFLYYFGGYYPILRPGFIVYKKGQNPIAFYNTQADAYLSKKMGFIEDTRYLGTGDVIHSEKKLYQHITDAINNYEPKRVGVVGLDSMMTKNQNGYITDNINSELLDITNNIEEIKKIKSPDEIDGIKKAFALAMESFNEFEQAIKPGKTCAEIASEIDKIARSKGAIDTLIFIEEGPYFLRKATNTPISENALITAYVELIDPNGYWVEKGGLFVVGSISEEAKLLADSCVNAIKEVHSILKPGIPINKVAETINKHTEGLNVKMGIWHGHGVGIDHDLPILNDTDTNLIEEGMILSVHPNFANSTEEYGASIADVFVITKDGAKSLSNGQYDVKYL